MPTGFWISDCRVSYFSCASDCVEFLALLERGLGGEDDLGQSRGHVASGARSAGLHQHRPALRRAGDVERTLHLEMLALVVQHVLLGRIEIDARLPVADEGVGIPAVP